MSDLFQELREKLEGVEGMERHGVILDALREARNNMHWSDDQQAQQALSWANEALGLAQEHGDREVIVDTLQRNMWLASRLGKHRKLLEYALGLLKFAEAQDDGWTLPEQVHRDALNQAGISSYYLGDYAASLKYHQIQHEKAVRDGADRYIAAACNGIGFVMRFQEDFAKALQHFEEAAEAARRAEADDLLVVSLNEIGNMYYGLEDDVKSIDYHKQAFEVAKKLDSDYAKSFICHDTGLVYLAMEDYAQGLEYMLMAEQFNPHGLNANEKAYSNLSIGHIHIKLGQFDRAEIRFDNALRLAKDNDLKHAELKILADYAELFEQQGRFDLAYKAMRDHMQLQTEVYRLEQSRQIGELETQYETERKEQEAEIANLRNIELVEANRKLTESLVKLEKAQREIIDLERKASALAMAVTANHEINQPLMVLRGNLDMFIALQPEGYHQGEFGKYLNRMEEAMERITAILDKFKEFRGARFTEYSAGSPMVVFDESTKGEINED